MKDCYIHIDDGYPESSDFDNNYVFFDPAEPDGLRKALAERNLSASDLGGPAPVPPAAPPIPAHSTAPYFPPPRRLSYPPRKPPNHDFTRRAALLLHKFSVALF